MEEGLLVPATYSPAYYPLILSLQPKKTLLGK
jgi:hypothetical protein